MAYSCIKLAISSITVAKTETSFIGLDGWLDKNSIHYEQSQLWLMKAVLQQLQQVTKNFTFVCKITLKLPVSCFSTLSCGNLHTPKCIAVIKLCKSPGHFLHTAHHKTVVSLILLPTTVESIAANMEKELTTHYFLEKKLACQHDWQ